MLIDAANLQALTTMYRGDYAEGLALAQPMWPRIATEIPSSTEMNLYAWLGSWPKMREWIGDRQLANLKDYGYSLTNKPFESTVAVLRDKIEDDQFGVFRPMMREMGYSAQTYPDENLWPLLAAGNATKCYDGQNFFDANHPVGGGVCSNTDTGGSSNPWYLLCTKRPIKPLVYQNRKAPQFVAMQDPTDERVFNRREFRFGVDSRANFGFGLWQMAYRSNQTLNSTNYYNARAAIDAFKTDQGQLLVLPPDLAVVGVSNRAAADALWGSQRLANGADNPLYKAVDYMVVPYLP